MPQRWRPPLHFCAVYRPGAVNCTKSATPAPHCAVYLSWRGQLHKVCDAGSTFVQFTRPGAVNCTKSATPAPRCAVCLPWRGQLHKHPGTGYSLGQLPLAGARLCAPAASGASPSATSRLGRHSQRDQPPLASPRAASRSSPAAPDIAGKSNEVRCLISPPNPSSSRSSALR